MDPANYLSLEDCSLPGHLKKLDSQKKQEIIDSGIYKCVDLTKAAISGGTQDANVENIVVIAWQHCERFKPASECAS